MSISSILNIAKNALIASQTSLQITAHNISNVTTEGYSKQIPVYEPQPAVRLGNAVLGTGVFIKGVLRYVDSCLEKQLAEKRSELEESRIQEAFMARIENLINDENSNLSGAITEFFTSWQELSLNPYGITEREGVRISGENLARTVRNLCGNLRRIQLELNDRLRIEISEANRIIKEIADLNRRIFEGSSGGSGFSDLMDKRQNLLRELSGKLSITYFEDSFGMITVLTKGGSPLVDGGRFYELEMGEPNEVGLSGICWVSSSNTSTDITSSLGGGSLLGIIKLRDETLEGILSDVDLLAKSIIEEVNSLHLTGLSLHGKTNLPFFKVSGKDYAVDMDLSPDIKSDLRNIASIALSEDGEEINLASKISSLLSKKVLDEGRSSFVEYVANLNGKLGQLSRHSKEVLEFNESTYSIAERQRESVSGVSIDEEVTNLIRYQYAYQAAARLFTVADDLLRSIIEAVR